MMSQRLTNTFRLRPRESSFICLKTAATFYFWLALLHFLGVLPVWSISVPNPSASPSAATKDSASHWDVLTGVLQQSKGERNVCGNRRAIRFSSASELQKIPTRTHGQSENRPSACPVMTFQMGNLWHQHGTIGSGELHFNFTLTRRELLLDTFTFRAFHVISPDHHALLDWETLTGTSQHICLEVTSAMRASQELRKQTLTLVIDILVNGESLCSRNYTAGLNHRNSNASDITMAYMPLETSATVLAFYQRSQTVPFFRSLFASYSRGEYRVVPPATWSRRTVERCRVHRFTLDVTPVGVITPQNITFGVCSGTCRSPLTSPIKFTQNAQLRSLLNAYDHVPVEDRPAMPCCSPPQNSQFEGQTVVVLKSGRPVVWHLPDLIPESCGCY